LGKSKKKTLRAQSIFNRTIIVTYIFQIQNNFAKIFSFQNATAVKIAVFWVLTPRSVAVVYWFHHHHHHHHHPDEAASTSKMSVNVLPDYMAQQPRRQPYHCHKNLKSKVTALVGFFKMRISNMIKKLLSVKHCEDCSNETHFRITLGEEINIIKSGTNGHLGRDSLGLNFATVVT
jgi:hypothetical protein